MVDWYGLIFFSASLFIHYHSCASGSTDPDDFAVLDEFRRGLENPELLKWPSGGDDPCGPPVWPRVICSSDSRVTQIQVQNLGLSGPLPKGLNRLTMLTNLGLQRNNFSGALPTFSGLSSLVYAYLAGNRFDTIPSDFFVGLTSLQVLALDESPLNRSTGWTLPKDIESSAQLTNLSLIRCNLVGPLPDFLGRMQFLRALKLSYNSLSGEIPASYSGLAVQILWLNNQAGTGLTGPIDVVASMTSLTDAWLHGNSFTGPIPPAIGRCTSLTRLWLNDNHLVGRVPENLTSLPLLRSLQLDNNKLVGSVPKLEFGNFTFAHNSFCHSVPGVPCSSAVAALLDFLEGVGFPSTASWPGDDPCSNWFGVSCTDGKVSAINLPNSKLSGRISPSLGTLDSLVEIRLGGNNLTGAIPENLTSLRMLRMLNVSANDLSPPVPKFGTGVTLLTDGNPLLEASEPPISTPPINSPSPSLSPTNLPIPPPELVLDSPTAPIEHTADPPRGGGGGGGSPVRDTIETPPRDSRKPKLLIIIVPSVIGALVISLAILVLCCLRKRRTGADTLKIAVAGDPQSNRCCSGGSLVVSVEILRGMTDDFSPENEIGRGGFGVVYKGELHDGTTIAVKRMESAKISNKAFDEFQAEIALLSKVPHRNLVSLLGYSVEGDERLIVYEYMPRGALSKHLFRWEQLHLEPLSWKKRLNIALDVARGVEYLHSLSRQCFIHRDLKSSNILLGDDYRAKVSDFGLVKLAPDGKKSVATRLAGTFGYLAPEYAVTGKITTKADVFSFGVVLMELITGLAALDEKRSEERRHLASWFNDLKCDKEKLKFAIDPSLVLTEETFESIFTVVELAGHCTAREPNRRPDMGHAVSVLAPLAEKWKPVKEEREGSAGIDLQQPLLQMVKRWQADDDSSKGSIPATTAGFTDSLTSADGR